ncbi:MAG: AraC family transcriptional regulator [Ruminococcaceae bacterium]|nr:AraC family transcriptional regulator [Oscillospiraceae bacterium]
MNILRQLDEAVGYIEKNLCAEIDVEKAAAIACVSADSFSRFFSYMTGMTLKEYVRCRRMTLAADDLINTEKRVIDIAVQYGYDSADAFSRAFARQHGITPTEYRKNGGSLKIYPPVSFHIIIKGAKEMNFRMEERQESRVYGISRQFEGEGYQNKEELRHLMWSEECEDIPGKLCEGRWNQPGNTNYDGIWYGIWQNGRYMIAREREAVRDGGFEMNIIPGGSYAVFQTEAGGLAWEELPKLFELIWESWLLGSDYRQRAPFVVEVYHLWTDYKKRKERRYYEVWIPIECKK